MLRLISVAWVETLRRKLSVTLASDMRAGVKSAGPPA